jgi:hypothetical protein
VRSLRAEVTVLAHFLNIMSLAMHPHSRVSGSTFRQYNTSLSQGEKAWAFFGGGNGNR